jgi:ubiquitin-conjugating enzyme E2 M
MIRGRKKKAEKKVEEEKTATSMEEEVLSESKDEGGVHILGVGGKKRTGGAKRTKKRTPGEIRIGKDISDLDAGNVADVTFPDPNDLTHFNVAITPSSGLWQDVTYNFSIAIPDHYPHDPPNVHCDTTIYHPNIDLEGNVCLNILREDWKPVLDINGVIYGLIYLFSDPNPNDPLNHEAAALYRDNFSQFQRVVQRTLRGESYNGTSFPRLK